MSSIVKLSLDYISLYTWTLLFLFPGDILGDFPEKNHIKTDRGVFPKNTVWICGTNCSHSKSGGEGFGERDHLLFQELRSAPSWMRQCSHIQQSLWNKREPQGHAEKVHLDVVCFPCCLFVFYHFITWSLRNPNTSQQVNETHVSSCFWKRPSKTICFMLLPRTSESLNLFLKKNPNQECMPPCNLKQLRLEASILRQNALLLLEFLARTVLPATASESHSLLSASCKIW